MLAPADAATNERVLASVELTADNGYSGHGDTELDVAPSVRGEQQLLPQVTDFQNWAGQQRLPPDGRVRQASPVAAFGWKPHRRRDAAQLQRRSPQSGSVTPQLPAGFSATPASASYSGLAPGRDHEGQLHRHEHRRQSPDLQPGRHGRRLRLLHRHDRRSNDASTTKPALELVPTTTIDQAPAAPTVDGTVVAG